MIRDTFSSDDPEIYVEKAQGGQYASKLRGYFIVKNTKLKFNAIAFGRIGGHNISLSISKKTLEDIKKMQIDPEWVELKVQRKLIEGDISITDSKEQKHKSN